MRPLELLITVVLLPYIVHLLSPSRGESLIFNFLPFIAAVLIICHLAIEGYRWQMAPAYGLAIALVIYECARPPFVLQNSYYLGITALLFEVTAILLSTALPIFILPTTSGPYKVASEIRHLVDEGRRDPFSDDHNRFRELMIQIWYPVDPSEKGASAPYVDKRITTFWNARLALVKSHSLISNKKLSNSQIRYPLLIYEHSWSGIRTESTIQVEELASHGYIVVGIDHPYSSFATVFPDGRIARRKFIGDEDYSSEEAFKNFVRTANEQVEIRSDDVRFVLNYFDQLNANDPQGLLTGRIDFDRVGIFGSSFGGTVAAETCWLDKRLKAGIDMGGMVAGQSATHGTRVPFFFIFEGTYEAGPYASQANHLRLGPAKRRELNFTSEQFAQMKQSLSEYGGYWMIIHGAYHSNFFDFPFYSPLRHNRLDPERASRLISQYVLAFFDKQIRGIDQPLLARSSTETPDVSLQVW